MVNKSVQQSLKTSCNCGVRRNKSCALEQHHEIHTRVLHDTIQYYIKNEVRDLHVENGPVKLAYIETVSICWDWNSSP